VINAGDGWGEHPTQVLTDLYTILQGKGPAGRAEFPAVGDMRMRTMHSSPTPCPSSTSRCTLRRPARNDLTDEFKKEIDALNLNYREVEHVEQAIADADVIYMEPVVQPDYTKARDERSGEVGLTPANYKITKA
jgi:aspartate carbamoyltransferase catalytic subunit